MLYQKLKSIGCSCQPRWEEVLAKNLFWQSKLKKDLQFFSQTLSGNGSWYGFFCALIQIPVVHTNMDLATLLGNENARGYNHGLTHATVILYFSISPIWHSISEFGDSVNWNSNCRGEGDPVGIWWWTVIVILGTEDMVLIYIFSLKPENQDHRLPRAAYHFRKAFFVNAVYWKSVKNNTF